jgi:hypothetical protein
MNTNLHETPQGDDLRFDRLVDGELGEEKRRELLAGLDNEPGGWRRCALAFLEAQCWKQTVRQTLQDGTRSVPATMADGTRRAPTTMRTLLAMAASFLLALGVVSWVQRARVGQSPLAGVGNEVAATNNKFQPAATWVSQGGPRTTIRSSNPWRVVTVSNDQKPGASFDLPAVERDNVDEQWLRSLPAAVPDNVLQALIRSGYQVQQRRELVPVPLRDGRRLVMPVDRVEVHYVRNPTD